MLCLFLSCSRPSLVVKLVTSKRVGSLQNIPSNTKRQFSNQTQTLAIWQRRLRLFASFQGKRGKKRKLEKNSKTDVGKVRTLQQDLPGRNGQRGITGRSPISSLPRLPSQKLDLGRGTNAGKAGKFVGETAVSNRELAQKRVWRKVNTMKKTHSFFRHLVDSLHS